VFCSYLPPFFLVGVAQVQTVSRTSRLCRWRCIDMRAILDTVCTCAERGREKKEADMSKTHIKPTPNQQDSSGLVVTDLAIDAAVRFIQLTKNIPAPLKDLADNATRAVVRVPMAIEEGAGRQGRDRMYHYRIAYSSCRETHTALRILLGVRAIDQHKGSELRARLDRIQGMIWGLLHSQR